MRKTVWRFYDFFPFNDHKGDSLEKKNNIKKGSGLINSMNTLKKKKIFRCAICNKRI